MLKNECDDYTLSHYYSDISPGDFKNNIRCENLERTTFEENSFDLVISQDVFEHILNPHKAFSEIARILKPEGCHLFTIPFMHNEKTEVRVIETEEGIKYLKEKRYHGNPIDDKGSLVVTDWGMDIFEHVFSSSGMRTIMYMIRDRKYGLGTGYHCVFSSR